MMDQRNREANKRYRTSGGVPCVFESKTIKLDKEVFQETKNRVEQEEDKNMSRFIEDTVDDVLRNEKLDVPNRRPYRNYPIKKTFTFSHGFVDKVIKVNPNFSSVIETALAKHFDLTK